MELVVARFFFKLALELMFCQKWVFFFDVGNPTLFNLHRLSDLRRICPVSSRSCVRGRAIPNWVFTIGYRFQNFSRLRSLERYWFGVRTVKKVDDNIFVISGLDLAHYRNGYVYHTSSDNISYISRNVIQHSGDNLLALTTALIQYDNLKEAIFETNDQAIYLDVFGKFMIYYSTATGFIINVCTIFLSVYSSGIVIVKIFKGTNEYIEVR